MASSVRKPKEHRKPHTDATAENYDVQYPLPARIATFLTLFRTTLPDLYAYFDEEEVDVIGLASAWLRHLLAAEMRIEDLMRLWGEYPSQDDEYPLSSTT